MNTVQHINDIMIYLKKYSVLFGCMLNFFIILHHETLKLYSYEAYYSYNRYII